MKLSFFNFLAFLCLLSLLEGPSASKVEQRSLIKWFHSKYLNLRYVHFGCYKDRRQRAIRHMIANNRGKPHAVVKCAALTKRKGFWTFGVQYNGQCFSANNAQHTFYKYGSAKNCRNGKGGDWANDVYFIVPRYVKRGCYKDRPKRAIRHMVANFRGDRFAVAKCAFLTKSRGYRAFGVQYDGQCFTSRYAHVTYKKYGRSYACRATGRGGTWANEVYFLKPVYYPPKPTPYVLYGCFKDRRQRAIKHMIASNVGKPHAVAKCAALTKRKGFWTFGVQYNGQCFSAKDAQHTFSKYGKARNCRNGKGGTWANDVYFFVPRYVKRGCYKDRHKRAIKHMVANFPGDRFAVAKCAFLTKRSGYRAFGVQYNGQCFTSRYAHITYKKYGRSYACKATGRGGTWANEVYFLKPTKW